MLERYDPSPLSRGQMVAKAEVWATKAEEVATTWGGDPARADYARMCADIARTWCSVVAATDGDESRSE